MPPQRTTTPEGCWGSESVLALVVGLGRSRTEEAGPTAAGHCSTLRHSLATWAADRFPVLLCRPFFFFFSVEMGFHCVDQAGFALLTSNDQATSVSQSVGITGVSHCAWPHYLTLQIASIIQQFTRRELLLYPRSMLLSGSEPKR